MNYRREIDRLRKHKERIEFNIKQISFDISALPPDLNDLFDEHHMEMAKLREVNQRIEALQPWWRKLLGVPY